MKYLILILLFPLLTVSCIDNRKGLAAVVTTYPDCEVVRDWDNPTGYFVRKPDGSVVYILSDGSFYTLEDNITRLKSLGETLIFKANK